MNVVIRLIDTAVIYASYIVGASFAVFVLTLLVGTLYAIRWIIAAWLGLWLLIFAVSWAATGNVYASLDTATDIVTLFSAPHPSCLPTGTC